MKYEMKLPNIGLTLSNIVLGCMRIADKSSSHIQNMINTAMSNGINFFDHADIYGGGESELRFTEAFRKTSYKRDEIILQSKCGIRDGFFDFSGDYILDSVEQILKRLDTDYLDIFLLHRPDVLMEADEVAWAFDKLYTDGKVKAFGVSNHNPMQIEVLKKNLNQDILINQLQFSLMNTGMIDSGLNVNMKTDAAVNRDGSVFDYSRLNDIIIQAWSPFQYGFFEGIFLGNDKFPELNRVIENMAEKYEASSEAVCVAWILRLPVKIQTVIGTTNIGRIKSIARASGLKIHREDWYELYQAAGNVLP